MTFYNKVRQNNPSYQAISSKDITQVNIQDVANFYLKSNKERYVLDEDFNTCVPPWNLTWLEWIYPEETYSDEMGLVKTKDYLKNTRIGHLVANMRLKDNTVIPFDYIKKIKESSTNLVENSFKLLRTDTEGYEVGWILNISTFAEFISCKQISTRIYFLDREGRINSLGRMNNGQIMLPTILNIDIPIVNKEYFNINILTLELEKVSLMGFNFCNCKNIKINEDKISRQARRNMERNNIPVDKTYTLEISSMRNIINRTSQERGISQKQAMHLCRGHFKTYTKDNPLLGKFTGTYWWDMHVRGDEKQGVINKNYSINV